MVYRYCVRKCGITFLCVWESIDNAEYSENAAETINSLTLNTHPSSPDLALLPYVIFDADIIIANHPTQVR